MLKDKYNDQTLKLKDTADLSVPQRSDWGAMRGGQHTQVIGHIDCSLVAGRAVATSLTIGLYLCNISSPHPHSLVNNITTVVNLVMESACEGF